MAKAQVLGAGTWMGAGSAWRPGRYLKDEAQGYITQDTILWIQGSGYASLQDYKPDAPNSPNILWLCSLAHIYAGALQKPSCDAVPYPVHDFLTHFYCGITEVPLHPYLLPAFCTQAHNGTAEWQKPSQIKQQQ